MAAVTGAIWKCATDSYENVERFEELDLVKLLVGLLKVHNTLSLFIINAGRNVYLIFRINGSKKSEQLKYLTFRITLTP